MGARKLVRGESKPAEESPQEFFVSATAQYLASRNLKDTAAEQESKYKGLLMARLEKDGAETDKGHRLHEFDAPLDGGKKLGQVVGIRRTKRVSKTINEERAMELIEKRPELRKRFLVTIEVLSEEGVLAANFEGDLTDKELEQLYDTKETFAFDLIKE